MSDETVSAALRSDAPLVVVEAPAGCGKTHQGADYARYAADENPAGRLLIVTHTHAACSVFSDRTKGKGSRVEIRTIDSVIGAIASAYHAGLGLPPDVAQWVRQREDGHAELAMIVAKLLLRYPMIGRALAQRYPIVICDEHQDSSGDQHALVMSFLDQGARLRIFADPMQKIFRDQPIVGSAPACDWEDLVRNAHSYEQLDTPHRWDTGCPQLGRWTLAAREALKNGGKVDLRTGLPPSVELVFAENRAQRYGDYQLSGLDRRRIDAFVNAEPSLLILTRHNRIAQSLRPFFNRRILLWEGHTRTALDKLVDKLPAATGNPAMLAAMAVEFMGAVAKGFSPTAFGKRLVQEAQTGCTGRATGKPALIQELARYLVEEPDHRGFAKLLARIEALISSEDAFGAIELDCYKEFHDAIRIGEFPDVHEGLAEITHRRTYTRPRPPDRAISTIHKAKGLECGSVVLLPCDGDTFPEKPDARCLLYVALSRAKSRLMLVLSRDRPSPLFEL